MYSMRFGRVIAAALAAVVVFSGGALTGAAGLMYFGERRRRKLEAADRETLANERFPSAAGALEEERRAYLDSLLRLRNGLVVLQPSPPCLVSMLEYDPTNAPALRSFKPVSANSECSFARSAVLWGSREPPGADPRDAGFVRGVAESSLRALALFSACTGLDGFLFELRGRGETLASMAEAVRECLWALSEGDPAGERCMRAPHIGGRGWRFAFCRQEYFVTSFGPCYPKESPRYAHGASSVFVLLQPYSSFLWQGVGEDTPETAWEEPRTARDRIRVAFRRAGRPYTPPGNPAEQPVAHLIVRPLREGDPPVACTPASSSTFQPLTISAPSSPAGPAALAAPPGLALLGAGSSSPLGERSLSPAGSLSPSVSASGSGGPGSGQGSPGAGARGGGPLRGPTPGTPAWSFDLLNY
eukprot:tig00000663_g2972.t1